MVNNMAGDREELFISKQEHINHQQFNSLVSSDIANIKHSKISYEYQYEATQRCFRYRVIPMKLN